MRQKNTHTKGLFSALKRRAEITVSVVLSLLIFAGPVEASTWKPTALVNTEAFHSIDDTDTAANVVLKFGDTLAKTLTYNRAAARFEFNDQVYVNGNLMTMGTMSGAHVHAEKSLTSSGTILSVGNITGRGTLSGQTVTGGGGVSQLSKTGLLIDSASTAALARIGNVTGAPGGNTMNIAANYIQTIEQIELDESSLHLNPNGGNVGVNKPTSATVKSALDVVGTISGTTVSISSSINGAGLTSCSDATTSKLLYNSATGRFSCGTDQMGGGFSSGNVLTIGSQKYVSKQGDTMTGALTLNIATTQSTSGALTILQRTHSTGAFIDSDTDREAAVAIDAAGTSVAPHLLFGYQGTFDTNLFRSTANTLKTNDALEVDGNLTFGDAISDAITVNASTWTFANDTNFALTGGVNGLSFDTSTFSVDALNDRIGIGTTAPKARLDVAGTISGSALVLNGNAAITGTLAVTGTTLGVGNISTRGTLSGKTLTIMNGNSYLMGNVGIGKTATPNTKLEVVGTISGSQLRAGNMTVSGAIVYTSGSTLMQTAKGFSGQILVGRGTGTPEWKSPTGSMVWYIGGTIATGGTQGPQVYMPFGFRPTSVNMIATGAPTGADLIVDLKQNGVSIFGTKPQINAGSSTGGGSATITASIISEATIMTLDVTQVGSTFAGSGLTVLLNGSRRY